MISRRKIWKEKQGENSNKTPKSPEGDFEIISKIKIPFWGFRVTKNPEVTSGLPVNIYFDFLEVES